MAISNLTTFPSTISRSLFAASARQCPTINGVGLSHWLTYAAITPEYPFIVISMTRVVGYCHQLSVPISGNVHLSMPPVFLACQFAHLKML